MTQENAIGSTILIIGKGNSCNAAVRKTSGKKDTRRQPKIIVVVFHAF